MGSRKPHAGLDRTWLGEAAIMFSTSTFLLKNKFLPWMRGMAKKRVARYFLKDIVLGILELETTDAMIPELEVAFIHSRSLTCLSAYGLSQPFEIRITSSLDWVCSSKAEAWGFSIVTVNTGLLQVHSGQRKKTNVSNFGRVGTCCVLVPGRVLIFCFRPEPRNAQKL